MNAILELVAEPAWRDVVMVLLHTLWQAPLIALAAFVLLRLTPARRAELRYAVCVLALTLMVMSAAGTWALLTRGDDAKSLAAATVVKGTIKTIDAREV